MSQASIARRYAAALQAEAEAQGVTSAVDASIDTLRDTLAQSRDLAVFFSSPVVSASKKKSIVSQLFAGKLDDLTVRFVHLLVDKSRAEDVPAIVTAYRQLRDEQTNTVEVHARSAFPLSDDEQQRLAKALEAKIGQNVRLKTSVDDTLIGGLVVRVGDTVYDSSVRNRLESLRERLESGSFLNN
ncbi:MAG: ATP synthase F1 subunit delta [Bacteroidota bacterium]